MEAYRSAKDNNGGIGAMMIGAGGKGVTNLVRPTLTDLRCDVDRVVTKCCPKKIDKLRFRLAYMEYDSADPIDMERYADKVVGGGRHNLEQGMGAQFIARGIFPLYGKGGYFRTIRQPRGSV
jgi:hypothetical protein